MGEREDELADNFAAVRERVTDHDYLDLVEAMQALMARVLVARTAEGLAEASSEVTARCRRLVGEVESFCDGQGSAFCTASVTEACGDLLFAVGEITDARAYYDAALEAVSRLSDFELEQLDEEPTRWGWDSNLSLLQSAVSRRVWTVAARGARGRRRIAEARLCLKVGLVDILLAELC